jgi:ABC-type phosphate transport system auxiliary subunit
MIDNYERLVGRLMDLETKFYELQEKYHTLINDYEKLKEEHEKDRLRYRDQLGSRYDPFTSKQA